jgi:condensin complex subunit 1
MPEFQLLNETQKLQNVENYLIPNEVEVGDMDERAINRVLEGKLIEYLCYSFVTNNLAGAVESVADNHEALSDPEIFDVYRSLLKYASFLDSVVFSY